MCVNNPSRVYMQTHIHIQYNNRKMYATISSRAFPDSLLIKKLFIPVLITPHIFYNYNCVYNVCVGICPDEGKQILHWNILNNFGRV